MAAKKGELVIEFSGATFMSAVILYLDLKHDDLPSIVFASIPAIFVALYKLVQFLTVFFNFHSTDYYRNASLLKKKIADCEKTLESEHLDSQTREEVKKQLNETIQAYIKLTPDNIAT